MSPKCLFLYINGNYIQNEAKNTKVPKTKNELVTNYVVGKIQLLKYFDVKYPVHSFLNFKIKKLVDNL